MRTMRWRARGFLFPLILIVVGGVALLANLGVLDPDTLWRVADLWPLLLILIGVEILISRTLPGVVAGPIMLAVFVVALVGAVAYAATAPSGSSRAPFARALPLEVRSGGSVQVTDTSAPLQGAQQGTLRLHIGAARVNIRGESLGEDLLRAHLEFPNGESAPTVTVEGGKVDIDQGGTRRFFFPRPGRRSVDLRLNNRVPWTFQLDGGALNGTVDLQDLKLSGLDLNGGAAHLDLRLPPPSGNVRVALSGGAIDVNLRLPPSAEARATMDGGANSLGVTRAGRRSGGFGSLVWESDGFAAAAERYEIVVSGGANHLRID